MTGFFNSNRSRRAVMKQSRYKPMIRYNGARSGNNSIATEQPLDFTTFSLVNGDVMILYQIEDIIPEYEQQKGTITNNVFDNIRVDRLGLFYSKKLKQFLYLAVNDNYECYILFKGYTLAELPNGNDINIENLPVSIEIMEIANRKMYATYKYIHDLTTNPIFMMTVSEVFKK